MRETIEKIRGSVRRLMHSPMDELGEWQRRARWTIDLVVHCWRELIHDRATQLAAALTYHTLFSLLPMLVLMLVIGRALLTEDQIAQFKDYVVDMALPATEQTTGMEPAMAEPEAEEVTSDGASAPLPVPLPEPIAGEPGAGKDNGFRFYQASPESGAGGAAGGVVDDSAGRAASFFEARREITYRIDRFLDWLGATNFRGIGIVGLFVFIWGATGLLATVERSFNIVYGVEHGRPWYLRLTLYYTTITLGPLVVVAGLIAQARVMELVESGVWSAWMTGPISWLAPLVTSWLVLFVMYMLLPHARVNRPAAAIGSLISAVLWLTAKEAFAIYVTNTAISSIYGALALVPIFLLWLWLLWVIVLFGLEVTYTIQAMRGREFKHLAGKGQDRVVAATAVIPVAAEVATAFHHGRTIDAETVANHTDLPGRVVVRLLDDLTEAGIVRLVESDEGRDFTLARPAHRVNVGELLAAIRTVTGEDRTDLPGPVSDLLEKLREHWREVTRETTLADLVFERSEQAHAEAAEKQAAPATRVEPAG